MRKAVVYLRVSTDKQGRSGLGLEAQRAAVENFLLGDDWQTVGSFVEVESGTSIERRELANALSACRVHGAVLVVAKLDRLARNSHFLLGLQASGVHFICCDSPAATKLTISILAVIAEEESRMISSRTRAALQAAKARGTRLGNPNLTNEARKAGTLASNNARKMRASRRAADLRPLVETLAREGRGSVGALAAAFNERGISAPRGGKWQPVQIRRLLQAL